ncbi:Histone acetyltransferase (MYST family) [Trachipleistophora hominis]|uniref:Histone acetyltransferase ESA1 n=1 Tax=Trachipleistophora hominis TaxID=72359 RepID=L7JTF2_TRAHO|nr:Histone acetyltransferase (MYST family) [Trachipleistophora hominis]
METKEIHTIDDLGVGYKLCVKKDMGNGTENIKAEILGIKNKRKKEFYVHYINFNRRLDEWLNGDSFVLDTVEVPKKRKKSYAKKSKSSLDVTASVTKEDESVVTDAFNKSEEYKLKVIDKLHIKDKIIDAWYFSPYPEDITGIIYLCSFCLFYFRTKDELRVHDCHLRHPPGNEIYRKDNLSFFELDGHIQKNYCRNLSLLSKLFLDHKTLFYDVDPFMFYVLCRLERDGYHIVGYFSKEKVCSQGFNLACLLILPYEQRMGYGKILIDFSYLLSKKENVIASPEKPLSDLGLIGYLSYWREAILEVMQVDSNGISVEEISSRTAITVEDVCNTLIYYKMVKFYDGELIFVKDRNVKPRKYKVDEKCLKWKGHAFNQNCLRLL